MDRQKIIEYCLTFKNAYEDYPFDGKWTVMRHSSNKKSFAFIFEQNNRLCVNLKCDPDQAQFIRQIYKDVTSGYHMNKEHWNTVITGGDVPGPELLYMISHSYDLIKPRLRTLNKSIQEKDKFWPNNLYYVVFGKGYGGIPVDAEESIEYVFSILKQREKAVLLSRFKDYMTFKAIGVSLGVGCERVRQIQERALSKIRHPSRSRYLLDMIWEIENDRIVKETMRANHQKLVNTLSEEQILETYRQITIEKLDLCLRSYNCLRRAGIKTLAELATYTLVDLMRIRNLGANTLKEIESVCEQYGIVFD
jgi:predicted DNA-binding protein (MmcQ/YjbR family)